MSKDIDFELVSLFDIYKDLLTENQKKIFELYYMYDLSLGEISENFKISRQSVNDTLNKAKKQLQELESKLGVCQKFAKIKDILNNLDNQEITKKILSVLEE